MDDFIHIRLIAGKGYKFQKYHKIYTDQAISFTFTTKVVLNFYFSKMTISRYVKIFFSYQDFVTLGS